MTLKFQPTLPVRGATSDGATDMAREQKAERDKELAQQSEATEPAGEVQP